MSLEPLAFQIDVISAEKVSFKSNLSHYCNPSSYCQVKSYF